MKDKLCILTLHRHCKTNQDYKQYLEQAGTSASYFQVTHWTAYWITRYSLRLSLPVFNYGMEMELLPGERNDSRVPDNIMMSKESMTTYENWFRVHVERGENKICAQDPAAL